MKHEKMNVVVVICHDMGHHLGCYGLPGLKTPYLDQFAAEGLRFQNNFCTAPQCSPSRAALWTGRYPHANGMIGLSHNTFENALNPGEKALVNILNEEGYTTHLIGGQHSGISGFKHYQTNEDWGNCDRNAEVSEKIMQGLTGDEPPQYIQIGMVEPHRILIEKNGVTNYYQYAEDIQPENPENVWVPPYLPPNESLLKKDLAEFNASIRSVDRAFGRIARAVAESKVADKTIVVFTVDHGIPYAGAKMTLYDPGIETAFLIKVPGVKGGKVYQELLSNVDFLPTILELNGIRVPKSIQGRSFKNLLTGEAYQENDAIFAEKTYHQYYDPMRAIRTKEWKLIANFESTPQQETPPDYWSNGRTYMETSYARRDKDWPGRRLHHGNHPPLELFNLVNDPNEIVNLAENPEFFEIRDNLVNMLYKWMEATRDPLLDGPIPQGAYKKRMKDFKQIARGNA